MEPALAYTPAGPAERWLSGPFDFAAAAASLRINFYVLYKLQIVRSSVHTAKYGEVAEWPKAPHC